MRTLVSGLCSLVMVLAPAWALADEPRGRPVALVISDPALPEPAPTVLSQRNADGDRLWNGMVIGGAIGAAIGMLVLPQAYCGAQDTECSVIVRVVLGVPAIAGGIGVGALVDKLSRHDGRPAPYAGTRGLQLSVRF